MITTSSLLFASLVRFHAVLTLSMCSSESIVKDTLVSTCSSIHALGQVSWVALSFFIFIIIFINCWMFDLLHIGKGESRSFVPNNGEMLQLFAASNIFIPFALMQCCWLYCLVLMELLLLSFSSGSSWHWSDCPKSWDVTSFLKWDLSVFLILMDT